MKRLMTICFAATVFLANMAVANITITPADGQNYTYQRWDFDTDHDDTASPTVWTLSPEADQNPYGSPSALVDTMGIGNGWLNNRGTPPQDIMHSGTYGQIAVTLTIPNLPNPVYTKILQIEFAYKGQMAGIDPSAYVLAPQGAALVSAVKGIDSLGWDEMTYTWKIFPQPESETILLSFIGGASGVDLNYIEVASVCIVPEPATTLLLGLGGVVGLVSRKRSA